MSSLLDIKGWEFGRLKVVSRAPINPKDNHAYWKVKCTCGRLKIVRGTHLLDGIVVSCGCYIREVFKKHQFKRR